jgi:hypothetical protein
MAQRPDKQVKSLETAPGTLKLLQPSDHTWIESQDQSEMGRKVYMVDDWDMVAFPSPGKNNLYKTSSHRSYELLSLSETLPYRGFLSPT